MGRARLSEEYRGSLDLPEDELLRKSVFPEPAEPDLGVYLDERMKQGQATREPLKYPLVDFNNSKDLIFDQKPPRRTIGGEEDLPAVASGARAAPVDHGMQRKELPTGGAGFADASGVMKMLGELGKGAPPKDDGKNAANLARLMEDLDLQAAQKRDRSRQADNEFLKQMASASALIGGRKADLAAYQGGDPSRDAKAVLAQIDQARGRRAEDESSRRFGIQQVGLEKDREERQKNALRDDERSERHFKLQLQGQKDARDAHAALRRDLQKDKDDAKKEKAEAARRIGDFELEPGAAEVTKERRNKLEEAQGNAYQLLGAIDTAKKLVDKNGSGFIGGDAQELRSTMMRIHFKVKDTAGLGVLSKSDMDMLESLIPNPTKFMSVLRDKLGVTDFRAALDTVDRATRDDLVGMHRGSRLKPVAGSLFAPTATVSGEGGPAPQQYDMGGGKIGIYYPDGRAVIRHPDGREEPFKR